MTALEIKDLSHFYVKGKNVLSNVSLELEEGEILSILGPSGCGKTTLLRIIAGLEKETGGSVLMNDQIISDHFHTVLTENRDVGLVVQERALFPHLTIINNVMFGVVGSKSERHATAMRLLKLFKVERYAYNYPNEISSGEQQRIAIARAMASKPKVLLADEPTGALDTTTSYEVMDLIQKINEEGKTILVVTHEPDIAQMCKRIVKLKDGVIIEDKKVKQVLASSYV